MLKQSLQCKCTHIFVNFDYVLKDTDPSVFQALNLKLAASLLVIRSSRAFTHSWSMPSDCADNFQQHGVHIHLVTNQDQKKELEIRQSTGTCGFRADGLGSALDKKLMTTTFIRQTDTNEGAENLWTLRASTTSLLYYEVIDSNILWMHICGNYCCCIVK